MKNKKLIEDLNKAIYYPANGPAYGINEDLYKLGVIKHNLLIKRIIKVFEKYKK